MKTTIDLPDALYRRVKARAALEGRAVRDVTIALYRRWLGEAGDGDAGEPAGQWVDRWLALADEAIGRAPAGPTAREWLRRDRDRLER